MKFILAHILAVLLTRYATCDVTDADGGCESQYDALTQMQRQLKSQNDVMLQLQARLDVYESRLLKQEGVIRQQEQQLRAQELRMTRQDKQSLRERETISRIYAELDMNENEGDMTETHEDGFSVNTDDQLKQQQLENMPPAAEFTESLKDTVHDDFTASHDVKSRADDFDSLEVTVIQMGQQLNAMGADIQALQSALQQQNQSLHEGTGASTYVHWGSDLCRPDAQRVYGGVMGGEYETHAGGAANYLCLTLSPVMSDQASRYPYVAYLYGAEYETGDAHQNKDPVCAVCYTPHATTLMIPGTNTCTPGWTKQYDGFLMAGYAGHLAASEFICVDSAMRSRVGSDASHDGKLLYYTIAQCGSLPCEPYVNMKVVTCVVCSL
jgi:hypothetical protein